MEKELVLEIFEKAKRAADVAAAVPGWSPEEELCLDALKRLKQLTITSDVMVSTQIGKRLRQLNNHPRKRIQAISRDVIETMKRAFLKELFKKGKNGKDGGGVEVGGQTRDASKSQKSMSDPKKQGKPRFVVRLKLGPVPVATPTPKQLSLSSLQKTNDKSRDKIREVLAESLCKVANEVNDQIMGEAVGAFDPCGVAAAVETELFNTWGSYNNGPDKVKYRSVIFNIKDDKNPDFRRKVLLGLFPPESISELTSEDMASDARRLENKKIREKAMFDCELVQLAVASSTDRKCAKCKKSQTIYHQMQTRRADEPMTTLVTCLNCNHHWKC